MSSKICRSLKKQLRKLTDAWKATCRRHIWREGNVTIRCPANPWPGKPWRARHRFFSQPVTLPDFFLGHLDLRSGKKPGGIRPDPPPRAAAKLNHLKA